MNKIAVIYTTFLRDELMNKTICSIMRFFGYNWEVFIGDQNEEIPVDKQVKYNHLKYYILPYDCGLSYARNYLVQKAQELEFKYCLLTADSIEFTSKYDFNPHIEFLESDPKNALIGFQLNNRVPWEFNLKYVPGDSFYLEASNDYGNYKDKSYHKTDICKNFFLAKTEVLAKIKWDNELKLQEHTDFFWRLKQEGYNCYHSKDISANYIDSKPPEYKIMRDRMTSEFNNLFMKKYNIKDWIKYSKEARQIFFEFNLKRRQTNDY